MNLASGLTLKNTRLRVYENANRRIYTALLASICCALMCATACGKQNAETTLSSAQMLTVLYDSQEYADDMTVLVYPSEDFYSYMWTSFGVRAEDLADGAVMYASGVRGDEIAVLHFNDDTMIDAVVEAMRSYINSRAGHFRGYVPEMALMLENAAIATRGNYLALLICPQPAAAEQAFFDAFDAGVTPVPAMQESIPEEPEPESEDIADAEEVPTIIDDEYTPDAVLQAWKSGDSRDLSARNLTILYKASEVLEGLITEEMTGYEKELAVHDWIIEWADYDVAALDEEAWAENPNPDSSTPYGLFVNQRAICRGYTSTFQLFMDMLDIECITVNGLANAEMDEHAWNMVKLDDEWYCVDVTWDDPVSSGEVDDLYHHKYFNVTTQFLRDTLHHWDADAAPEAIADKYRWHEVAAQ